MAELRELIREIIREEIELARTQSVSNRYKMVRVNNVLVPSAGKVYVVPVDNEATFPEIVVNRRIAAVEGLEVVVGVDNTSNVRQVLDIFDGEIFDQDDYTGQVYQPLHAPDHGWTSQTTPPFNNPAVDAVSIGQRGFIPLRARPAKAGGTKIDIAPFTYEFNDSWVVYPGSTSFNLTSNVPSTSGKQQFTLVYLDKTTNTILTADGTESIYAKSIRPLFPTLPSGKIEPIALVRLYNGQSSINEAYDIYDVRRVVGTAESDTVDSDGRLRIYRSGSSIWYTDLQNVNTSGAPRIGLIGGNSTSDASYYALVGSAYSTDSADMTVGFQTATSFTPSTDTYETNNYGLTIRTVKTTGLNEIVSYSGSASNGGDIEFKQQDGTTILFIDDSAQDIGVGTTSPQGRFHVVGGDGQVGTFPTIGARDLFIYENNQNTNIILITGATNTGGFKFYKDAGSTFQGGIFYENSTDSMNFRTNGNNRRLTIDSAGLIGINGVSSPATELDIGAGAIEFTEMTEPAAGATNTARLYTKDNGAGKSQLCVRFATGAVQVLATEP